MANPKKPRKKPDADPSPQTLRTGEVARAAAKAGGAAVASPAGSAAPKKKLGQKAPKAKRAAAGARGASEGRGASRPHEEDEDASGEDESRDGDDPEVIEVVAEVTDADSDEDAIEAEIVGEPVTDDDDDISVEDEPRSKSPASRGDDSVALSRTDPLQAYLREVQRHRLLTPEEEQMLTRKYADPDTDDATKVKVAARLVTANLRLVVKLAYEYRRAYKNIMDLVQEGNIGLMQAVKRFDPTRGVKLSSYAAWWIRAYMLRFILNNWRLVKLGTTQAQRKLFFNLNKEKAKLAALGVDPTAELIAERLGVETKEVVDMDRRLSSAEASLDAPVGDAEGRSVSRIELLPSPGTAPDMLLERREMDSMVHERLESFRKTLQGKDGIIFDKRMAADEPLTLQELGDEFGVSRERVRQLEARVASKLRTYLEAELGDAVRGR